MPEQNDIFHDEYGKTNLFHLIDFPYKNNQFSVFLSEVRRPNESTSDRRVNFSITNTDGTNLGTISGLVQPDCRRFISFSAKNKGVEGGAPHIPGLIKEAIATMVSSGIVSEWYSSMHLSPGGKILYDSLSKDNRLRVQVSNEYDGNQRFKVVSMLQ